MVQKVQVFPLVIVGRAVLALKCGRCAICDFWSMGMVLLRDSEAIWLMWISSEEILNVRRSAGSPRTS